MKKIIASLALLLLTACSSASVIPTSHEYYELKTKSGFSVEDEVSFALQAEKKEKQLASQEDWEIGDVAELARYYDYSGRLGRAVLLYETYIEKLTQKDELPSEAISRNIAVVYSRLGDYNKSLEYFDKHLERFQRRTTLKEMANIYTEIGDTQKATEYMERFEDYKEDGKVETK